MAVPKLSDKDKQIVSDLAAQFAFDPVTEHDRLFVIVAGKEGMGKTHLACTMAEVGPVYVLDTEFRAGLVTSKFKGVQKATVRSYKEMLAAAKAIVSNQPAGTVVIDSGTDLRMYAEADYLEKTKMEKVWPQWNWAEVYAMCDVLFNIIRFSKTPFRIVLTSRVKEEYQSDKPTGNLIPRIHDSLPYKADLVLQCDRKSTTPPTKVWTVRKDGFNGKDGVEVPFGLTLPAIIKQLR